MNSAKWRKILVFFYHYITSYIQYHLKSIFDNNGIQTYILHVFDAVVFYFIMLAFVTEYPLPRMPAMVTHINKVMNQFYSYSIFSSLIKQNENMRCFLSFRIKNVLGRVVFFSR